MIDPSCLDSIADGLAEYGYAIVEDFLFPSEIEQILSLDEFKNVSLHFSKAGIGKSTDKKINESIRSDYIRWIDRTNSPESLAPYFDNLDQLTGFINQSLFLGIRGSEIHLTYYPEGAFYKRHLDQFKKDSRRKLSVICYLNNDWKPEQGGALRMYLRNGPLDILPTAGRFICFRSDQIEHEVLPATRTRMSITGWLLDGN